MPKAQAVPGKGPRVLVVGAGAVGLTFGRALAKAGAEVYFWVKPQHRAALEDGAVIYPLRERPEWSPEVFRAYSLVDHVAELPDGPWDQVWLTVASPALRGVWLGEVLRAVSGPGSAPVVILLQPGLHDRKLLMEHVDGAHIVRGLIPFMAWHAPLPGEVFDPPGLAIFQPPLTPAPFSGPLVPCKEIVALLEAGGQPAVVARDVDSQTALGSNLLLPLMATLEIGGWTFAGFRRNVGLGASATRSALRIAAHSLGQAPPWWTNLVRAPILWVLSFFAPFFVPVDLETYLRVHFTKVGGQTREALELVVSLGQSGGLPVAPLQALAQALPPAPLTGPTAAG